MGIGSSAQKRVTAVENGAGNKVVNQSSRKNNFWSKNDARSRSWNENNSRDDMGSKLVKENFEQNLNNTDNFHPENMTSQEKHFGEWRRQMTSVVERLQTESAEKDAKINKLLKQAKSATDNYEKLRKSHGVDPGQQLIETLTNQNQKLQQRLNEKEEVIRSLQKQLLQSRTEKDSQVSVVKETVEMVIREKDSEIRRLKALWNPADGKTPDLSSEDELVSRVTKLLNSRNLEPGKKNTRFGISAENRSSKNLNINVQLGTKTIAEKAFIRKALNSNVFLKGLDSNQVTQLIECMSHESIKSGMNVITEGEYGTHLFVLEKGQVEVYHSKSGKHEHVAALKPGTVFGELAILYNCKRTASVRATTDTVLWSLERQNFQSAVKLSGQLKRDEYVRLLKTVDKLKSLSDNKLMRIADCLEEATFQRGDYVIRQGDSGDTFYVIKEGKVRVTHLEESSVKKKNFEETFVCYLGTGEYFGELALLTEDKRSANIIVESESISVLMLDRQAFNSLVGSIADASRSPSHPHVIPLEPADVDAQTPSNHLETLREESEEDIPDSIDSSRRITISTGLNKSTENIVKNTPLDKLKTLKVLGQGGFGCVKLVRVPGLLKSAFALKCIRKAKIIKTGQQQHVLAERNIMLAMKSPFIGTLYRTYKDDTHVYMLMDAYLGGEVYGVLKRQGALNDASARFCAACVLEALDYLHLRGIVYRDMKPENLMLDHKGYIKLVDFGFAKRVRFGYKTWTFCGTPEYFPPEILTNTGHDFSADYWSFGILIYELLTRTTPFFAGDDMTVYENILGGIDGVKFSKRVGKSAEVLVRALCRLEPRDRLGYQKGGVNDIRKQRWFQGFDWQGLRAGRIDAPFKPDVRNPMDTKHFDHVEEDKVDIEEDLKIIAKAKFGWDENF
ncbi:unnamed protein product [Clavelina lepadiformis]|uniref:cGMP-dependent protein kinase n=1 Tax=Clavelina lepadiformis TaxID=159417 RepID=A0ABP0G6S0_CLALP